MEESWDEMEFIEEASPYRLVYLFSEKPMQFNDPRFFLADTKITFLKEISGAAPVEGIEPYQGGFDEKLLELALLSGKFSRFKVDPRLHEGEFEKLYTIWVHKAFQSSQIFSGPDISGMVTLSVNAETAGIGLIAVSEDHQKQGWGKKLVKAAEYYAHQEGGRCLEIPTQERNLPACGLYRSLGYIEKERSYVYHFYN